MDPHLYINPYIFHGVFEILSTFLGCPSQNVEHGQRPPTQNVEIGRLGLVVLVRKSDFCKVPGLARNPSKDAPRRELSIRTSFVSFGGRGQKLWPNY